MNEKYECEQLMVRMEKKMNQSLSGCILSGKALKALGTGVY